MSSAPSHNLPIRHTSSRHHAHSVSLGAVNPSHRVTRRKSMTSTAVNNAAVIAAAINGADEKTHGASVLSNRRSLTLRDNGDVRGNEPAMADHSIGSMDDSRHAEDQVGGHTFSRDESAIDDVLVAEESNGSNSKARARRASEGAYLSKVEGKRASGELRCEKCGKGYKHSSCLTKHLSVCPGSLYPTLSVPGSTRSCLCRLIPVDPSRISCNLSFEYHWSSFVNLVTDGSILPNGHTLPNSSYPNTSKSSCLKQPQSLLG